MSFRNSIFACFFLLPACLFAEIQKFDFKGVTPDGVEYDGTLTLTQTSSKGEVPKTFNALWHYTDEPNANDDLGSAFKQEDDYSLVFIGSSTGKSGTQLSQKICGTDTYEGHWLRYHENIAGWEKWTKRCEHDK